MIKKLDKRTDRDKPTITSEINLRPQSKGLGRLSQTLIEKGIVSEKILQDAVDTQSREPRSNKRKLIDILIDDFNVNRNSIFVEMSKLYGFEIINLSSAMEDRGRIEFIKDIVYKMPEDLSNQLLQKKVIPFKWHDFKKDVLVLVTGDPTNEEFHILAKQMKIADFDIAYAPIDDIENLIHEIFYSNNEFLQKIFDEAEEIEVFDDDSKQVDEEALDSEINKSRLVNLIEGREFPLISLTLATHSSVKI